MGDKKFVFMMFGLLALLAVLLLTIDSPSDKGKKTLKHKTANNVEKKVIANPKPVVKKLPVKPADLKVKSVEKKVVDDKKIVTKKVENKSLEKAASDKIDNELLATYKWGRINAGEFIEYYNKLDSMKKVSLAKKSLFTELLKFFVQIQVSYNLALDQGYQNRLEVKIPINQQEQWFVVEKTVFENVQAKNEVSETEIKDYYEKIKLKDYKIEPGVDGVLISSSDLTVLQKIKKDVENGMKLVELKKKNLSEYKASIKELKLVRKGQRGKEFDKNVLVGNFLGCSKIFSVDGSNTFFNVTKRNPSGFRPFDNVKPYLTTKLKSLKARGLYDKFLLDLTQKYSAKIDSDFLKEVSSFCRTKLEAFKGRRLRDIIDNDFDTFYKGMQKSIPEEFKKKVLISIKGNDVKALEFVNMCFVIPAFYSTKGEKIDEYIVNLSNKMRDQEVLYREGINAGYDKDKILLKRLEGFKRDIITNEYTRKLLRDYVDFSEERLKKYYDEHPKEFIERAKIKASHILVKTS
ncbi:hypothetical protein KAJ27_22010, partial [bacterium]|nr:hypothetical protein [bacterium]